MTPSMISISPRFGQFGPTIQLSELVRPGEMIAIAHLQCRPASTVATRNVSKVGYDEAMCISVLALHAYTLATGTIRVENGLGVDAHVDLVVLRFYEAF